MAGVKYYDWVVFFASMCKEINTYASNLNNRENLLMDAAIKTFKPEHAILQYNTIDPFSFIYALAQQNTVNRRTEIFSNAKSTFNIVEPIPSDHIFPTPTPNALSLFYARGNYIDKEGTVIGNNCLWQLFKEAYEGEALSEEYFLQALSLKNVGFTKLSQALFLINPKKYIAFDNQTNTLPVPELNDLGNVISKIGQDAFKIYNDSIQLIKASFVGCELYEVNLLNVLLNSNIGEKLVVTNKFCQISSWADGQNNDDYFEDFVIENSVWTGGSAGRTGARIYPLTEYNRGDIVLVRRGTKWLGGVGIILNNEYIPSGYSHDKTIQVLWLAKASRKIEDDALGQWDGFSHATGKTIDLFKIVYPEAFKILDEIRIKQRTMIDHASTTFKNIILQGPPGTGKTRLAKQIAQWLVDDSEKDCTLIEAIDQRIFTEEPEIEDLAQVKIIQFHPSYTYEDFVRGIKADTDGERIVYKVENRILAEFAYEASKPENLHKAYVLIIDEINRANLTSVLGELIYALEYRGKKINSMYSLNENNEMSLPHNLYIIGTMNTADRSVSHIDYAIRRRFTFVPVLPDVDAITSLKAKSLFDKVNNIFNEFKSPEFELDDIRIGHSYFLFDDKEIDMKLKYEIRPLLLEYVKDGILFESAKDQIKALNG